ncbi:MAG: hypothetical protein M3O36_06330 [Myxococcota bacterium]|nr:hypothetical protein [Myxococcota bacterium]
MASKTETDITVEGIRPEDVNGMAGGASVFVQFEKKPTERWKALFSDLQKTSSNALLTNANVRLDVRGTREGVSYFTGEPLAEETQEAIKGLIRAANEAAKSSNDEQERLAQHQQSSAAESARIAQRIRDKLTGK